ncbi:MAG: M20 family metallopeptidase [Deltaproteobacteria bacterium]|nr:M20 family metallopeptidase [Deltaproteobacteria bacterium]MBZ0218906.1 M20 family metallopeptidase [Deltaproteobacteria bacterium]
MRETREEFLAAAEGLRKKLTGLSDDFYRNPELGLKEARTSSMMQALLKEHGFHIESGIAGMETAFRASIGSGGPVIALLAEMDALPGIGHACGHNLGGTASIGAGAALAKALAGKLSPGNGTLLVLGTPAEELGKGKIEMIKAGVFDGVDAAMMVHGSSGRRVVKHFLGLVRLNFTFHGKSSHASAYPEEGINALDAVILLFNSIGLLRQQMRGDVRVHGIITDGGKAPNIIPEKASACFYVRAKDLKELDSMRKRVIECARGAAVSTGCSLEAAEGGDLNAPMKINMVFAGVYRRALEQLGLKEDGEAPEKNVGSSDIGNVSQIIPTIHPHVPIRKGINIHTQDFADATITPDGHRALMEGVKALGLTAIELFFNTEALETIRKDFRENE